MKSLFRGCGTAIITPLKNNKVDFDAYERLIRRQIDGGVSALIILGTTGEPATFSRDEKREILTFAKQVIGSDAAFIAGTGGNNTATVIEDSAFARDLGADGLLIVTPYYNKCTQNGLIAHYTAIADAVRHPIIAYNVPGRTGMSFKPETIARLSDNPYIYGYKEASGDMAHNLAVLRILDGKIPVYSGDDGLNYLFMAAGAEGVISVASNVFPSHVSKMCAATAKGDYKTALKIQNQLFDINRELFCEVNPIPTKAALKHLGLIDDEVRLPLTRMEQANRERLVGFIEQVEEI